MLKYVLSNPNVRMPATRMCQKLHVWNQRKTKFYKCRKMMNHELWRCLYNNWKVKCRLQSNRIEIYFPSWIFMTTKKWFSKVITKDLYDPPNIQNFESSQDPPSGHFSSECSLDVKSTDSRRTIGEHFKWRNINSPMIMQYWDIRPFRYILYLRIHLTGRIKIRKRYQFFPWSIFSQKWK